MKVTVHCYEFSIKGQGQIYLESVLRFMIKTPFVFLAELLSSFFTMIVNVMFESKVKVKYIKKISGSFALNVNHLSFCDKYLNLMWCDQKSTIVYQCIRAFFKLSPFCYF